MFSSEVTTNCTIYPGFECLSKKIFTQEQNLFMMGEQVFCFFLDLLKFNSLLKEASQITRLSPLINNIQKTFRKNAHHTKHLNVGFFFNGKTAPTFHSYSSNET